MKYLILAFLLFSNNVIADSPLTSIEFWKVSEDSYVLKIGKERGKKKLDNVIFKFLTDSNTTIFDNSLVNYVAHNAPPVTFAFAVLAKDEIPLAPLPTPPTAAPTDFKPLEIEAPPSLPAPNIPPDK